MRLTSERKAIIWIAYMIVAAILMAAGYVAVGGVLTALGIVSGLVDWFVAAKW